MRGPPARRAFLFSRKEIMDTYYKPEHLAKFVEHRRRQQGAGRQVLRLVRRGVRGRRAVGAREGAHRARGGARRAVPLLHRRLHAGVPQEGRRSRADDRGRARRRGDPRRRLARARRADAASTSSKLVMCLAQRAAAAADGPRRAARVARARSSPLALRQRCSCWRVDFARRARRRPARHRSRPTAHRDLPDQRRQALQPDLPALPRRRRPRPRDEMMDRETIDAVPRARSTATAAHDRRHHRRRAGAQPALPLAGRRSACARGKHVMDRCNLTVLADCPAPRPARRASPSAASRSSARCRTTASANTDAQRGDGVFEKLDRGAAAPERGRLRRGRSAPAPDAGAQPGRRLPRRRPGVARARVEARGSARDARRHASTRCSRITNMPITRFLEWLESRATSQAYMERLVECLQPGGGGRR